MHRTDGHIVGAWYVWGGLKQETPRNELFTFRNGRRSDVRPPACPAYGRAVGSGFRRGALDVTDGYKVNPVAIADDR